MTPPKKRDIYKVLKNIYCTQYRNLIYGKLINKVTKGV